MVKMQRASAIALFLAIVLIGPASPAAFAQAQTAEAPMWKVGYKWTFRAASGLQTGTRQEASLDAGPFRTFEKTSDDSAAYWGRDIYAQTIAKIKEKITERERSLRAA